jgi:hypothetical protein
MLIILCKKTKVPISDDVRRHRDIALLSDARSVDVNRLGLAPIVLAPSA